MMDKSLSLIEIQKFFKILGPTGIDSLCIPGVSMPGVVGITRK
jgi:hypothetical protein